MKKYKLDLLLFGLVILLLLIQMYCMLSSRYSQSSVSCIVLQPRIATTVATATVFVIVFVIAVATAAAVAYSM